MAGQRKSGIGCGTVYLLLAFVLVFGLWHFGIIDRALYLMQVQSGATFEVKPETSTQQLSNVPSYRAYDQLNEDERERYLILLDAFTTRESHIYPESNVEELEMLRDCVLADHPELFYVTGAVMHTTSNRGSGLVTEVTVGGQFSYSEEETVALQTQLDDAVKAFLADLPANADDYAKAKYVYTNLAQTVVYDHAAAPANLDDASTAAGQTVIDALVSKSAVCAGYAKAYQYLMLKLGVPCLYVEGMANGEGHAWCAAWLDGDWYLIDPTWGDPQYQSEEGALEFGRVNYDYLCVTNADLAPTHNAECPYRVPTCTAMADNYYVREGLYLYEPDVVLAGSFVQGAAARGDQSARFRLATREAYDAVVKELFDDQAIARYIPGDSCTYLLNDRLLTAEVAF